MKVLVAIDGSEAALQASRLVAAYQGDRSALQVTLVNVQRPPLRLAPQAGLPHSALEEALRADGERALQPARAILQATGIEAADLVRVGPPADTLLDLAAQSGADVLVMGVGRQGLLRGYAIGSVALRVAAAAACPVVLVRADAQLPAELGRRLRVTAPVDGSPESVNAVRRLAECAPVLGELHVDLVHFHPGLPPAAAILPPHQDVLREWSGSEAEAALAVPAQLLADHGISHEVHGLVGTPDTDIAPFARERQAGLIAMATRGTGAMHHLVLGSTCLRTAHVSEVPLVLMR